jgi:hypothetical protein
MKQFRDFEYQVYEDGRIYSNRYKKFLKTRIDRGGYELVSLRKPGHRLTLNVHRVVCEVYHPNPDGHRVVLHINGDRLDNHKDNLRWGTQSENIQQAYDEGTKVYTTGFTGHHHTDETRSQISKTMRGLDK